MAIEQLQRAQLRAQTDRQAKEAAVEEAQRAWKTNAETSRQLMKAREDLSKAREDLSMADTAGRHNRTRARHSDDDDQSRDDGRQGSCRDHW